VYSVVNFIRRYPSLHHIIATYLNNHVNPIYQYFFKIEKNRLSQEFCTAEEGLKWLKK